MPYMSDRFNFDDFEKQIDEALAGNEEVMAEVVPLRRPGDIGAVACQPTLFDTLPDPPEAA